MTDRITLTASQFKSLVAPTLPFAGRDDMLGVLSAVLIESRGKWLTATTTDRFRVAVKRIEKRPTEGDESTEWPGFRALVPLRSARSVLDLYKPRRHLNPEMTLTVEGKRLIVEGSGGFDLFDASRFEHQLVDGEYPNTDQLFRKALATKDEDRTGTIGVNPAFLADFKAATDSATLSIATGGAGQPVIVADDQGFIGALMPRKWCMEDDPENWTDFFAEPAAETKAAKRPAKKRAAKKVA